MSDDLTPEEFADGMALWQEHKPLTGEDWVRIAVSTLKAGNHAGNGSPVFEGLLLAVAERDRYRAALERIVETFGVEFSDEIARAALNPEAEEATP